MEMTPSRSPDRVTISLLTELFTIFPAHEGVDLGRLGSPTKQKPEDSN